MVPAPSGIRADGERSDGEFERERGGEVGVAGVPGVDGESMVEAGETGFIRRPLMPACSGMGA